MPHKTIHVTAERIAMAKRADSNHCMVADAIKEAIPEALRISVDVQTMSYSIARLGLRFSHLTPRCVQEEILRFDEGTEIEPWSFRMPRVAQTRPMKRTVRESLPNGELGPPVRVQHGPKTMEMVRTSGQGVYAPIVRGGALPPKRKPLGGSGKIRTFGIRASKGFNPAAPK